MFMRVAQREATAPAKSLALNRKAHSEPTFHPAHAILAARDTDKPMNAQGGRAGGEGKRPT